MSNASVDIFTSPQDLGEDQNEDQRPLNFVLQILQRPEVLGSLLSGLFLILSIPVDLANISTIAGHSGLRPSGYFHLVTLLSAFNIVFFILNFLVLALEALTLYELVPQVIFKILSVNAWISKALYDLIVGLVGLQILLLCVMTMELRFDLSRHFYFKPKGQTCMRVFLTLLAFAMVIIALAVVSLIRTTDIFWDTTAGKMLGGLWTRKVISVIWVRSRGCENVFTNGKVSLGLELLAWRLLTIIILLFRNTRNSLMSIAEAAKVHKVHGLHGRHVGAGGLLTVGVVPDAYFCKKIYLVRSIFECVLCLSVFYIWVRFIFECVLYLSALT